MPQDEPGDAARISPDDALPPVEAPGVSFILKLFIVPAIIVVVVVSVVFAFSFLATSSGDPYQNLAALEQGVPNRGAVAHDLARMLAQDPKLRGNAQMARRISNLLLRHVKSGPPRGDKKYQRVSEAWMRKYLCIALGQFEVREALPGLVEAAQHDRSPEEFGVRAGTVLPLAMLAANAARSKKPWSDAQITDLLIKASEYDGSCSYSDEDDDGDPRFQRDRERVVRQSAATGLGMVGGPKAIARLEALLIVGGSANVRFNAATALARHGNTKCVTVVVGMIDPQSEEGISEEKDPGAQIRKRLSIRQGGLLAAEHLAEAELTDEQRRQLLSAIDKLIKDPKSNSKITGKAREVRKLVAVRPH